MNIFVGSLSFETTDKDLLQAFSVHGAVDSARVITDRDSGQSRGFGFVEMPNQAEALAAITALNGRELNGRTINVNEARPRAERGAGGGGNRGGFGGRSGGGSGGGGGRRW
jgi:RNA recognition motif-containing protein